MNVNEHQERQVGSYAQYTRDLDAEKKCCGVVDAVAMECRRCMVWYGAARRSDVMSECCREAFHAAPPPERFGNS